MDMNASTQEEVRQAPGRLQETWETRDEFRRLRVERKLPQERVARELGVTQASLSAWETGKNQSLRAHTMNKVIRLIELWRMDSNIVPIPSNRIKTQAKASPRPRKATINRSEENAASKDRAREKVIEALREKLGPEALSAKLLDDMAPERLLDYYILSTQI